MSSNPQEVSPVLLPTRNVLLLFAVVLSVLTVPGALADPPRQLVDLHQAVRPDPGSRFQPLGVLEDGRAIFAAADPLRGLEPWVTDGTPAGTRRLGDLCPGECDGVAPFRFARATGRSVASGVFFFGVAEDGVDTAALWFTDGTADGTRRLPMEVSAAVPPDLITDATGRLFVWFRGLRVSDGTAAGTGELPLPLVAPDVPDPFGGRLGPGIWFLADTGVGGTQEPWVSDGTPGGTRRLVDGPAVPGPRSTFYRAYRYAALDGGGGVMLQNVGSEESDRAVVVWSTDGTPQGTRRVRVLDHRWVAGSPPLGGPEAAFVTVSADDVWTLWTTDGTRLGTRPVEDSQQQLVLARRLGDRLLYVAATPGGERWDLRSLGGAGDVDALGTFVGCGGPCPFSVSFGAVITEAPALVPVRRGVAFLSGTGDDRALWLSDGTAAGTRRLAELCDGDCGELEVLAASRDGERLFVGKQDLSRFGFPRGWSLLSSDGTAAGTVRLPGPPFEGDVPPTAVGLDGGRVLFAASEDDDEGTEPWVSDGTTAGTARLGNLARPAGNGDADPRGFTRWGDRFVFFAREERGWGLWDSDGTAAGTELVGRIGGRQAIDDAPERLQTVALVGDFLYFTQPAGDVGGGVLLVADLAARQIRSLKAIPRLFGEAVELDGKLLWHAFGEPLVVSDGTVAGTRELVLDGLVVDRFLVRLDESTALFNGYRNGFRQEEDYGIWRTDGTAEGTRRIFAVDDLDRAPDGQVVLPGGPSLFVRTVREDDRRYGELWRTDGTTAGTRRVFVHDGVDAFGVLRGLTASGEQAFYFLPRDGGFELWRTDGTAGGTVMVARPRPRGGPLTFADRVVAFRGGIVFRGHDDWHGPEPWVSDGTESGTRLLAELRPGDLGSFQEVAAVDGRRLVLRAAVAGAGDGGGARLWLSDGTPEGTVPVTPEQGAGRALLDSGAVFLGDEVFYAGRSPAQGSEPWVTSAAADLPLPPPPSPPPAPRDLTTYVGGDGDVSLVWQQDSDGLHAYRIEGRTPADGEFRLLDQIPGDSIADQPGWFSNTLPAGVPHTLRVRAVNAAGESPPSEEVSVVVRPEPVTFCVAGEGNLCLLADRFRVAVHWRDRRSGDHGVGTARPIPGSDRSGTFWFFDDANVELIVKVLDGTFVNRRWWVFNGGLTDVETWIEVIDTEAGDSRVYHQGGGDLCGFADTDAFAGEPADAFPLPGAATAAQADTGPLELVDGRFRVEVDWRDPRSGDTGTGRPLPWSANTGFFWFFQPENVELVVKVLDGGPVNGNWWVFFGGLTDVAYTVRVTDVVTGDSRVYEHSAGDLCGTADTVAFPGS